MSGLDRNGFVPKTYKEIVTDIFNRISSGVDDYDGLGEIDRQPDTPLGQIVYPISEGLAEVWQELQKVHDNNNMLNAEGLSLDYQAEKIGLHRLPDVPTRAVVGFEWSGTDQPDILEGETVKSSDKNVKFDALYSFANTTSDVIAKQLLKTRIKCEYVDSNIYSVKIDDILVEINSDSVFQNRVLADAINLNLGYKLYAYTPDDDTYAEDVIIESKDFKTAFMLNSVNQQISVVKSWTKMLVDAQTPGNIEIVSGDIDTMVSTISGVDGVTNFIDGYTGRDTETDRELRLRINRLQQKGASATVGAIRAKLLDNVPSLSNVVVFEDTINNEIEVVVQSGYSKDIAQYIYENKPAGILSVGNTSETIEDANGNTINIGFSRVVNKWLNIKIEINEYNDEEVFPIDGLNQIKQNIIIYGRENFDVGDDFIKQKFYLPVYNVSGIKDVNIKTDVTASPNPESSDVSYSENESIAVNRAEILRFQENRIEVIDNT